MDKIVAICNVVPILSQVSENSLCHMPTKLASTYMFSCKFAVGFKVIPLVDKARRYLPMCLTACLCKALGFEEKQAQ
jgi:hypothetical protein